MNVRTIAVAIGASVLVAGCSPLAPQPDHSKFFILAPLSDTPAAAPAAPPSARQMTIGIGPIDFPDYLRRPEVVTRTSPNQFDLSSERRWGEPLDKNFTRVLAENLSELLNTQRIETYPWPRRVAVDYQIAIAVQRFEASSDGQSQLVARWIIKDGSTGKDLYATQTSVTAPVATGDAGASAALSDDLSTLSKEIAARVTEINQARTRSTSAGGHQGVQASAAKAGES